MKSSNFIDFILGSSTNREQGPGSIKHSGGKCIHVLLGAFNKPKEGQFLVTYTACGLDRLEFQLLPSGILMFTKYSMCVKPIGPVIDGVKVGKLVLRYISCYNSGRTAI